MSFSVPELKKSYLQSANATNTGSFMAFFFLAHYGFFHFVYLIFLLTNTFTGFIGGSIARSDVTSIGASSLLFFLHHGFSYLYNRTRDDTSTDRGALFFYPYARIIPMHLTIIFGALIQSATLPFFLILKTVADVIMHIYHHRHKTI